MDKKLIHMSDEHQLVITKIKCHLGIRRDSDHGQKLNYFIHFQFASPFPTNSKYYENFSYYLNNFRN